MLTRELQFSNVPANRTDEVLPRMKETISKVLKDGETEFGVEQ